MTACELVGVSRRTIYNWIAAGKVEYVRTAGGSIRIFADTLWRDAGERGTGANGHQAGAASGRRRGATRRKAGTPRDAVPQPPGPPLRSLFHRLNNQLGVVLAHAELLELKTLDAMNR